MKPDSRLAQKIERGEFIVTAEYFPPVAAGTSAMADGIAHLKNGLTAVNVADNHDGVMLSSLAASAVMIRAGVEPICQIVTRDRNRIALQSDLLGAASLGIRNVLCLSGYHPALTGCPAAAGVFDIDSIQLIAAVKKMNDEGLLLNGTKIEGAFSMLIGAAANPYLEPLELNIIRLGKKVTAGAGFIQTQAVFDVAALETWLDAASREGITEEAAILAGVRPLAGAAEACRLNKTYTDLNIPEEIIVRLAAAGDEKAQRKEGLAVSAEIIRRLKTVRGLRGIHLFSGGNEAIVPELIAAAPELTASAI